jgi:hypothetical protein
VGQALVQGDLKKAMKRHEARSFADRDRLIYLLDAAIIERMAGSFEASNRHLEEAKKLIEHYSTVSVSEQAGTFVINDTTTAYAGEEFEQVLVHLYSALNYLEMGDLYAARVEALQVDVRLQEMARKGFRGRYRGDPLARYLSGVIFEALREHSDALIAYRHAYEAFLDFEKHFDFKMPRRVGAELVRLSEQMGRRDEAARYRDRFGLEGAALEDGDATLVVVVSAGLAPLKRESSTVVQRTDGRMIRVSLPYYEPRNNPIGQVRVVVGAQTHQAELFHPIEQVARDTLHAKMPAITARAIARTVAKHQLSREAEEQAGPVAGLVANLAGVLSESADTRSWFTLPSAIYLMRTELPAGEYRVRVEGLSASGALVVSRSYGAIKLGSTPRFLTPHLIAR